EKDGKKNLPFPNPERLRNMARYDRVLIDPAADELTDALHEAVLAANDKRRSRLLGWPLPGRDALEADLDSPEGWRQWNGGGGPARSGEGRSVVALAWWTDRLGRKHHRLVGRYGNFSRPMLENIFCPLGDPRPALWFVYPDHVFLKRDGQFAELQAMCACGAWGRPEELGWMGPCCDACYDRGQEGQAGSPAWIDPRCGTFHGEEGRLMFLASSPDGRTLAAGMNRDRVTLYDTSTGEPRGRLQAASGEWLLNVGWLDNGTRLVTAGVEGQLRFWSGRTGLPTDMRDSGGTTECFAIAPEGGRLARSDRRKTVLLSAQDGSAVLELPGG